MPQLRQMLADQGVRLADWRLEARRAASASSRPAGMRLGTAAIRGSRTGGASRRRHDRQSGAGMPAAAQARAAGAQATARRPVGRALGAPLAGAPPPGVGRHCRRQRSRDRPVRLSPAGPAWRDPRSKPSK